MAPLRRSISKRKQSTATVVTPPLTEPQPADWWHHFSQRFNEELKDSTDSQTFESMFKMSMKTFCYITSAVQEQMVANDTQFLDLNGNQLNLYDMVAIALWLLSSGESFSTVGTSLNLNQATVAELTKRFVEALLLKTDSYIYWPSTKSEMRDIISKFEKIGGLPNCCGVIDSTHILMTLPVVDRSANVWCDRQGNHSMTLQAIVDPYLRFRDINAGHPGSLTDEFIYNNSLVFKRCEDGVWLNGKQRPLSDGGCYINEYIVGDSSLPLQKWMLTPYRGDDLSDFEVIFNDSLFDTQMVAKNAFVKLKENWKILKVVWWRPDKRSLTKVINACCILHNILIDMEDEVQEKLVFDDCNDLDYCPVFSNADQDLDGSVLREKFECRNFDVKKLLNDKKFWFASFLIAWAAALQGHMMWLQRQDSFKQKFGTLEEDQNTDNQHDSTHDL
ncbi:hypothetical protein QVD17_36020 [Tagetes erecta]|uniref:DDE Tnp4 domain-containing protein n=1 Tax=Tagetes erecta TaxID=13708 RepID=A0AAD8JRM6_TARER|nr:hypothetical protein QVD17_36020 [Tagetes erecta]